jgi:hypothetical protein
MQEYEVINGSKKETIFVSKTKDSIIVNFGVNSDLADEYEDALCDNGGIRELTDREFKPLPLMEKLYQLVEANGYPRSILSKLQEISCGCSFEPEGPDPNLFEIIPEKNIFVLPLSAERIVDEILKN